MVIGTGSPDTLLTETQIEEICRRAFDNQRLDGKRLLFIVPDHTRSAPMDMIFRVIYRLLADRAAALDFLIALGTHPPMSEEMIARRFGFTPQQRQNEFSKARFFNHRWDDPQRLVTIGILDEEEVELLSGGRLRQKVTVTINRRILDYDRLIIVGPTFPHEVVGFSGGNKYLFPGIAGAEIIDMFHWLGALITNLAIIGVKYTPVRDVIDRAASMVPIERYCMSLVVRDDGLAGLFLGPPEEAWSAAADLSAKVHIVYKDKPFQRILACAPAMYEDLWTGGKCVYKLEPVAADGAELIIYAPHISEVSITHGFWLERIGYHVRDFFVKQMDRFTDVPYCVLAHSTHVKGAGSFENGIEKPRIRVALASSIPPEVCERINLEYRDPRTIRPEEWMDREAEGVLYVPHAGEKLYRLKSAIKGSF
ncbi:MAG: lactate racemase domain-containing protein [candidate division KSB1 bacterium]|nr:lactate racemase domain-containing protein [candidate division KSB1 bacterium]